jgi:putative ABC transport system substrate-binding protein
VEGKNVRIEYRWAEGRNDRLPALVAELLDRQIIAIAVNGDPGTRAARAATGTIPVVFQIGGDPVAAGLVTSLSRPSGNVTGVTGLTGELVPKRLEVLHELMPSATTIAVLINPTNPTFASAQLKDAQAAGPTLGLQVQVVEASTEAELDKAFAAVAQRRAGGLVIGADAFFNTRTEQLAALSIRHHVPTVFQYREFAMSGGLMSYGGSVTDLSRLVGLYVGRILKGEKPADLPVQQATKVELIINLKTAKALGLTVPTSLLVRAEEVIE